VDLHDEPQHELRLIMSIVRLHTGAWQCSDIIGGHLVTRTYYGMTKREARAAFRREFA